MDASEKITLMLGALTKEAAKCAGRAERLDEIELNRIWAKLEKTYDNKYQQVYAHISSILNIQSMTNASAEKLRSMIDVTDEHLRMLRRFDIDTSQWSSIVCVIILNKLDIETRNQWETKSELPLMPDIQALFSHMEQRILAIRNVEQSARQQPQQAAPVAKTSNGKSSHRYSSESSRYRPYDQKPNAKQSNSGNRNQEQQPHVDDQSVIRAKAPDCPMCGRGVQHWLWNCDSFRALPSPRQEEELARWGLCKVCLVAKHSAAECNKGECPVCKNGKHNSAICPKSKAKSVHHVRKSTKKIKVHGE